MQPSAPRRDEFDPDVEDFLIASTTNDKYSYVLIEGMEFMNNSNPLDSTMKKPANHDAMLIKEGHQDKSNLNNSLAQETTLSFEIMEVNLEKGKKKSTKDDDIMSTFSNLTKNTKKSRKQTGKK